RLRPASTAAPSSKGRPGHEALAAAPDHELRRAGRLAGAQPEPGRRQPAARRVPGDRPGRRVRPPAAAAAPDPQPSHHGEAVRHGDRRRHPLQSGPGADHPRRPDLEAHLGFRGHPAEAHRSLRPGGAGLHHHRDPRHHLGQLPLRPGGAPDPRVRPHRRGRVDRHHHPTLRTPAEGDLRMSAALLGAAVTISQLMLVTAMGLYMTHMVRGPRAQDRVVALDACYVSAMLLLITLGMRTGSTLYFEASAIIALLGFASTVALAKFLMRGEVIE